MNFSSADYPIFLCGVFFLYTLVRLPGRAGWLARLALLLLLGDLVYLLLVRDVGALCDPLGALAFRALVHHAPPWRSPLVYAGGLALFAAGVATGLRWGDLLDAARAQVRLGIAVAALLVIAGALLLVATHGADAPFALARMTAAIAAAGHPIWLALLGLALGAAAAPTEHARHFGRLLVLFLASAVFYHAWAAGMPGAYKYLLLVIVGTITLDYWLARWIHVTQGLAARRALLVLSLVSNLGVLALFKYFDFFLGGARVVAGWLHVPLAVTPFALILPAGISFHTFQSLSYTIDVYRKQLAPTRSFLEFATFVLFFPQLVAGPIVRAGEFLPQLADPPPVDAERAAEGFARILVGLFKKLALADVFGVELVDRVFSRPGVFSALEVVCAVYGYAFQIYCDFSAYSDIAIGSAQLLGFTFPENFRAPYVAATLQDFWRRWHITLSTWLRDYLYIPLGGSQGAAWKTYRNLAVTMLLGGLWHGANWTYIVWGLLHGGGLAATRGFQRAHARDAARANRVLGACVTVAVLGAAAHLASAPSIDRIEKLDPTWIHLALAWAYVTPAWAALTAWLVAAPAPDRRVHPVRRVGATLLTFHYVCFAWIFFRATSFARARAVLAAIGHGGLDSLNLPRAFLAALAVAAVAHAIPPRAAGWLRDRFVALPPVGQAAVLSGAIFALRLFARPTVVPFIYFQF